MKDKELSEDVKQIIDSMPYEQLLKTWRFAESGHPLLTGEAGKYFESRMHYLRKHGAAHDKISKKIGWKKQDDVPIR